MEIATTKEIVDCYNKHKITYKDNKKWISVDSLIDEIDKTWHKINTCKMNKLRSNFITKTQVASYLSELLNELRK